MKFRWWYIPAGAAGIAALAYIFRKEVTDVASQVADAIKKFVYTEGVGGRINPDPVWVSSYITPWSYKQIKMKVNRLIAPALTRVFQKLDALGMVAGPVYWIRNKDTACYVPRHKMWDPARNLSEHAYGLAVDVNWTTNPLGGSTDYPPGFVNAWKSEGFVWGGDWTSPKDYMHYQKLA